MRQLLKFVGLLILSGAAIWYSLDPRFPIAQGLDLKGGVRVTLSPDQAALNGEAITPETMRDVRSVLEKRVNSFGLSGSEVRLKGTDQVLVVLPGARNPEEALKRISKVAQLELVHLRNVETQTKSGRYQMNRVPGDPKRQIPETYTFTDKATNQPVPVETILAQSKVIVTGNHLQPVSRAKIEPGGPVVEFSLEPEGAKTFGSFTQSNLGEVLAVVLDKQIISAPTINQAIEDQGVISGGFANIGEAKLLADLLNSGALPIPLKVDEAQTVGATLGQESINRSISAGIAGLGLVLAFMLLYYWLPGLLACIAMLVYAAINFAIYKGFGVFEPIVLDLPGITGFILSVGMAVDGNVLIFERLKEELKAGRSFNAAVDAGFSRAFSAIIDSNVTVWIICAVLLWLGMPMIKGFAITLAIGTAVSMFSALTVTRVLLQVVTAMPWARNPKLYGLNNSWLALAFPAYRRGGILAIWSKRRIYFGLSIALAALSLVFIALTAFGMGLKPGIDFTGGSVVEATFRERNVSQDDVRRALSTAGIQEATVRMGRSEQPWTRVTIDAPEVDEVTARDMLGRLSQGEGMNTLDPASLPKDAETARPAGKEKGFHATVLYAGAVTEQQVRTALTSASSGLGPLNVKNLKVAAQTERHQGENRPVTVEVITDLERGTTNTGPTGTTGAAAIATGGAAGSGTPAATDTPGDAATSTVTDGANTPGATAGANTTATTAGTNIPATAGANAPGATGTAAAGSTTALADEPTQSGRIRRALDTLGGGTIAPLTRVTFIGPTMAREVTVNGLFSVIVASLAIVLFLAFRFALGGFVNGLKFGAGAIVALFHDVVITIGFFALMGYLAGWRVDSLFVTACLGLLGFSVNDTIVVYDRIRENLRYRQRNETLADVTDRSMTQTFDRSFNTSFAVILALAAMVIFGGESLRLFNIALLFGMAIGTYSSIFVASPLVVLLERATAIRADQAQVQAARGTRREPTATPVTPRRETTTGPRVATVERPQPSPAAGESLAEPLDGPAEAPTRPGQIRPKKKRRY